MEKRIRLSLSNTCMQVTAMYLTHKDRFFSDVIDKQSECLRRRPRAADPRRRTPGSSRAARALFSGVFHGRTMD